MTMTTILNTRGFKIETEFEVAKAVLEAGKMAKQIGFKHSIENTIAIITSELASNILRHAFNGELIIRTICHGDQKGIEIVTNDEGPGIENIAKALTPHYSSKNSLGLGLPAVKRLADEFTIESQVGKGTSITIRKWIPHGKS